VISATGLASVAVSNRYKSVLGTIDIIETGDASKYYELAMATESPIGSQIPFSVPLSFLPRIDFMKTWFP
jgi:hypothetical protein